MKLTVKGQFRPDPPQAERDLVIIPVPGSIIHTPRFRDNPCARSYRSFYRKNHKGGYNRARSEVQEIVVRPVRNNSPGMACSNAIEAPGYTGGDEKSSSSSCFLADDGVMASSSAISRFTSSRGLQ